MIQPSKALSTSKTANRAPVYRVKLPISRLISRGLSLGQRRGKIITWLQIPILPSDWLGNEAIVIKDGADVRFHQISIIPFVPLIHLKRVSAGRTVPYVCIFQTEWKGRNIVISVRDFLTHCHEDSWQIVKRSRTLVCHSFRNQIHRKRDQIR